MGFGFRWVGQSSLCIGRCAHLNEYNSEIKDTKSEKRVARSNNVNGLSLMTTPTCSPKKKVSLLNNAWSNKKYS